MVEKAIPKEIIDSVTNNTKKSARAMKKRRTASEASIARPIAKELPEKFGEFTKPIPAFTVAEEQGQTTVKIDKGFENVFSKLVGDAPSKRNEKNPNAV